MLNTFLVNILRDLEVEEDAERVEALMLASVREYGVEAQYRGALRLVRRLSRELQQTQLPAAAEPAAPTEEQSAPVHAHQMLRVGGSKLRTAHAPWKARGLDKLTQLYRLLEAHPRLPYDDIAKELYGNDDARTKSNVRSTVNNLKKRGMVRAVGVGAYEIVRENERHPVLDAEEHEADTSEAEEGTAA
jgi:hypothetical protein